MDILYQDITVDITESVLDVAYCNQGEKGTRAINCHVQDNGCDYAIPSDVVVNLKCHKSNDNGFDRTIGTNGFGSINGNIITIPIIKEMTISSGRQICDIEFVDVDGNILKTTKFIIRVSKAAIIPGDMIIDKDDYQTINDSVIESSNMAKLSKSYAIGNTGTRDNENVDNAKYYAEQAKHSETKSNAKATVSIEQANIATTKATEANTSAVSASESANIAITKANDIVSYANKSESYAVGNTGTRDGENIDNSKYYAEQAKRITEGLSGDIQELELEIADMKAFVGYTDDDIYGVEVDFKNKKFTRLAGAVNRTPGAAFDSINAFGGRKRCNVDNSGNVIAYYGDAGFSTTGKLTQAVTVGEGDAAVTYASGTIVQVMVEQPKFYYKVVPLLVEKKAKGSITRKIRYYVSDTAKAGFKLHPAFIVNGQENEKIYVSAFEGSLWDASASTYILDDSQVADFAADMLSSIANAKPMSGLTQNLVRSNVRKLAEKRGTGWEQATVQTAAASELLMLIEYASFNMQSAIGQGAVNKTDDGSSNMSENTGTTITLGNASGTASNANGVQFVTYRGEENFWGNIWKWVDGLNQYFDVANKTSTIYIADHGFTDDIGTGVYEDAGIIPSLTNGYVSAFCYSEDYDWLFIAGEVVGDSSLPVGDYFWQTTTTGWRVAVLGAGWGSGLYAGAFGWDLNDASSHRNRNVSGRLVYRKKVA